MNVGQLLQVIHNNLNSDNEELRQHAKTLLGPREHGSTTKLPLSMVNKNTQCELFTTPVVTYPVKCYIFHAPQLGGKLGALPLLTVQTMGYSDKIIERDGKHGKELFCPLGPIENSQAEWISVLVGPFNNEEAVYTWHPGYPLKPYTGEPLANCCPTTSVKTI